MVTYSDRLPNVEIKKLFASHEAHGKFTMETTVQLGSLFGISIIDRQSPVRSVSEKPRVASWGEQGFFGFSRKIFDYLEDGAVQMFETESAFRPGAERKLIACELDGSGVRREWCVLSRGCETHTRRWLFAGKQSKSIGR
jgi:NDP-sugar pyrophosphorylase family protein